MKTTQDIILIEMTNSLKILDKECYESLMKELDDKTNKISDIWDWISHWISTAIVYNIDLRYRKDLLDKYEHLVYEILEEKELNEFTVINFKKHNLLVDLLEKSDHIRQIVESLNIEL